MEVRTANTIIYCSRFAETVDFYQNRLGLPVAAEFGWLVEFKLNEYSFLSVADENKTSTKSSAGEGLVITLRVDDIDEAHSLLEEAGVHPTAVKDHSWGARVTHVFDPEGTRIEFWQPS